MIHLSFQSCSSYHILGTRCFIFFRSSKLSQLSCREPPSKLLQGFTLCFQLLFLFIILLLPDFFMEALHGGSSRIPFIFNCSSRFLSKLWPAKLYSKNKHGAQHMLFLRSSSILLLVFRSVILSTLSLEMVLYHSWQFAFMLRDSHVVKNEVF